MSRGRLIAVAASLALAATATAVQAAGGSTLALSGSHRNTLGQNFNYTIHGFAAAPANRVVAWEQFYQRTGCAQTYIAEKARTSQTALYGLTLWDNRAVTPNGAYSVLARFGAANVGKHGICAYLIDAASGVTYAHAGAWWVNVKAGGGGTTTTTGTLEPAPVGSGQCQAGRLSGGSVYAQIAVSGTSCAVAATVAAGAPAAHGAAFSRDGFACKATAEGPGSKWSGAWGGTYYAYSCASGSEAVAFNWGTDYTY